MYNASEYTLFFRIEADSLDFEALDKTTGIAGSHEHIHRKPRHSVPEKNLDRWEAEAEAGTTIFDSLGAAFSSLADGEIASALGVAATNADLNAFWWCGCFHLGSPALTVLTEDVLNILGRSCSPIFLGTYHSPEESHEIDPLEQECPDAFRDQPFGHQYRFGFSNDDSFPSEDGWGPYFERFDEGLEAELRNVTRLARRDDTAVEPKKIVCEHIQYAFDGGPRISASHSGTMAALGMEMVILWRDGWSSRM